MQAKLETAKGLTQGNIGSLITKSSSYQDVLNSRSPSLCIDLVYDSDPIVQYAGALAAEAISAQLSNDLVVRALLRMEPSTPMVRPLLADRMLARTQAEDRWKLLLAEIERWSDSDHCFTIRRVVEELGLVAQLDHWYSSADRESLSITIESILAYMTYQYRTELNLPWTPRMRADLELFKTVHGFPQLAFAAFGDETDPAFAPAMITALTFGAGLEQPQETFMFAFVFEVVMKRREWLRTRFKELELTLTSERKAAIELVLNG